MKAAVQRFAAALSAAFLVSCGGGSDGGTAAQLEGAIVKGPVTGSSVCAYRLLGGVKGEKLNLQATSPGGVITNGCFVTGADGGYAFTVPGYTGEVLLEASGGTFCSDETQVSGGACGAGGAPVALTETMTAAASVQNGSRSTTYVTPLSTAAVEDAKANGGVTLETFRSRFATLAGTVLGPNSTVTPATAPTPTTHTYLANAAKQMQGGASLHSVVSNLQSGNPGSSSSTSTSPGTVSSALVGTHNLVFKAGGGKGCGTLCSYTDGGTVAVAIHADGRLVVGDLELTNPFVRSYGGIPNLHEIIWLDSVHKIEYALSDNATGGEFNEINVFDATAATLSDGFLGQIRKPEVPASEALATMTGTFNRAFQYSGNSAPWGNVTVESTGAITFAGGTGPGPSITAAQVASVTSRITCCNRVDIAATIDINGDGTVNHDDVIRLYQDASGNLTAVEYYAGASHVSSNQIGVAVGRDNPALPADHQTAIPTSNALKATVNNVALDLAIEASAPSAGATSFSFNATNASGPLFQVTVASLTGALQAGGTYECIPGKTAMFVNNVGTLNLDVKNGGRCRVQILELSTSGVTGRFVAQLGDGDRHKPYAITDGVFRFGFTN